MFPSRAIFLTLTLAASTAVVGAYETSTLEGRMVAEDVGLIFIMTPGGAAFRRTCPNNHVLTGIRYRKGIALDGIGIQCRPIRSDGTLGTQINSGDMAGGNGGTYGTASCAANHVMASGLTGIGHQFSITA